ncbi:MAG: thymidylate synthase, partial [Oscillospiraceae bacterium]|nr:thymidylate synthase [Oscillospiraceae bacterium]
QRSQDMLAANNWNVCQYAVLTHMMAQVSGLKAGEFVHVIADAHIYDRHVPIIEEIIKNELKPAPKFTLDASIKDFYDFTPESFKLEGYEYTRLEARIPVAI